MALPMLVVQLVQVEQLVQMVRGLAVQIFRICQLKFAADYLLQMRQSGVCRSVLVLRDDSNRHFLGLFCEVTTVRVGVSP